jgi:hypothetical protein
MRRLGDWGVASRPGTAVVVALLVVLGTAAVGAAADDEDGKSNAKPGGSWFSFGNWFGTDKKPADPTPATSPKDQQGGKADGRKRRKGSDKDAINKESLLETEPSANDLAARRRALEEAALLRRDDVCDRLAEIAVQTNDAELANLAEQLKQRAWEVYTRRTAHLPTVAQAANSGLEPLPGQDAAPAGPVLSESRLGGGGLPRQPVRDSEPLAGREEYR